MEFLISDLMNDYFDNECYPTSFEAPEVSTERIRQMTMKKICTEKPVPIKRPCKLGRTLLIAAVCAAFLILGAFAAYQIAFGDVLIGEPYGTESVQGEAAIEPWDRIDISVNGTADSPEYQACAEWKEWNEAWWAENPNPWAALGVDDTYFETSENYAWIYNAYFTEQADKLDEIAAKYGLTLHTLSAPVRTEDALCSLLGLKDLWKNELSTDYGTVFENGSFTMSTVLDEDMRVYIAVNADGSFSTFCMSITPEFGEWSYVTADGTAVTLAMADSSAYPDTVDDPINGFLVTRLDKATVTVSFTGIESREELEAAADRLNLADLSELFAAGADRSSIPAAVKEYKMVCQAEAIQEQAEEDRMRAEAEKAELAQQAELEEYRAQHSDEEWDALITAELGSYEPVETLPGQYEVQRVIINTPSSKAVSYYSEETPNEQGVLLYYTEEGCADPAYVFRYERQWTDESHAESLTRERFEAEVSGNGNGTRELVCIGEQEVYVSADAGNVVIEWYDEERDLRFTIADMHIINDPETFSKTQLFGLAESFIESLKSR